MLRWISDRISGSPNSSPNTQRKSSGDSIGQSSSPAQSAGWTAAFASDPDEWENGFDKCWVRAERILDSPLTHPERDITFEEVKELGALLSHMVQFLMMEVNAQPEPAIGPILDRFFTHQIFDRAIDWAQQCPDFVRPTCQLNLIRVYEHIVVESHSQNHCILVHKPILNPLLRILQWSQKRMQLSSGRNQFSASKTNVHFVILLNQICAKMAEDPTLFHFFFTCTDDFIVFSLLVPFLYEQDDVGQLARDALLLILSVSSNLKDVADFIATRSDFCPVVATGLSGCFSQLTNTISGDGCERLIFEQFTGALTDFHSSLLFCNAVVQASHSAVASKICEYFYSGFLLSVVKPALLQDEESSVISSTVYLQVCLEALNEPELIRTVFRMLLVEREDREEGEATLIDIIVRRTNTPDKLGVASLSLLDRLIDLSCEDVFLALMYTDLMPTLGSKAQLSQVRDRASILAASTRILAAVPSSVQRLPEIHDKSSFQLYCMEAANSIQKRINNCASWKWSYDGVSPSHRMFREELNDDANSTNFTRMSSVRSSYSSASTRFNKYFSLRHGSNMTISTGMAARIGALGASPSSIYADWISGSEESNESNNADDDLEYVLPPISSSMMQSSMMDYLTLTAYDSLSESDGDKDNIVLQSISSPRNSTVGIAATASEVSDASSRGGLANIESVEELMAMLDEREAVVVKRPVNDDAEADIRELTAFIDTKYQAITASKHLEAPEEGKRREEEMRKMEVKKANGRVDMDGQRIRARPDGLHFLEVLLERLRNACEQSMAFNIQMCSLFHSLASFPHPLLIKYFLLDGENSFIATLEGLKLRIDDALSRIEGADIYIRKAARQLGMRADRIERAVDACWARATMPPRPELGRDMEHVEPNVSRTRLFGNSARKYGFRYHSHLTVDEASREETMAKDVAFTAVLLAGLCQMMAASLMQHSLTTSL